MVKSLQTIITFDLLLDYNSLLFSLLRSHFLSLNVSVPPQTKSCIELKNPSKAFDSLCKEVGLIPEVAFKTNFLNNFRYYLQSIKPQISAQPFVNFLKKSCDQIYLSSYLDPEDLDIILKYHKDWLDFPVITYKESFPMEDFIKNLSNNSIDLLFIDGNIENLQKLSLEKPDYLYLLIKNSNFKCKDSFEKFKNPLIKPFLGFEDVDLNCFERNASFFGKMELYPKEFMLDFTKKPLSEELSFWTNILYLPKPLKVESYIIRGFGRGGKQLGMPTANLEITPEINELLKPIIPGIYFGWAKFNKEKSDTDFGIKYEKTYKCVISTGFNPFYENREKTFEVYVMDRFEKDYYGAFVSVDITGFIRCESDLKYFDHLIKIIHNDVHIAEDHLKHNILEEFEK